MRELQDSVAVQHSRCFEHTDVHISGKLSELSTHPHCHRDCYCTCRARSPRLWFSIPRTACMDADRSFSAANTHSWVPPTRRGHRRSCAFTMTLELTGNRFSTELLVVRLLAHTVSNWTDEKDARSVASRRAREVGAEFGREWKHALDLLAGLGASCLLGALGVPCLLGLSEHSGTQLLRVF